MEDISNESADKFWYGNKGCPGCYKEFYPYGPAPGQRPHMEYGGCLSFTEKNDETNKKKKDDDDKSQTEENPNADTKEMDLETISLRPTWL